jgi:hypothetical protein
MHNNKSKPSLEINERLLKYIIKFLQYDKFVIFQIVLRDYIFGIVFFNNF